MYISRIYIRNYKNFDEFDLFIPNGEPLTIIGGNNAGKTNLLQALRIVLDTAMPPWEKRLGDRDFCWNKGSECWKKGEEIVITVTFSNVTDRDEIEALLYSIAPNYQPDSDDTNNLEANISFVYAPSVFGKSFYDLDEDYIGFLVAGRYHPSGYYYLPDGNVMKYEDRIFTDLHACEHKEDFYKYFYLSEEDIEKVRQKSAPFEKHLSKQVYANRIRKHLNLLSLDALRDVKNDFYQGYNSLVSQLLRNSVKSNSSSAIAKEITDALASLRTGSSMPEGNKIIEEIETKLQNEKLNLLTDKANLVIGTPNVTLENIGRYFNFLVNLHEELKTSQDMEIIGLGYQNLAYISAIFALFELKKEVFLNDSDESIKIVYNLLLIEEPEAHLDVQNQKFLHTQIEKKTEMLMRPEQADDDSDFDESKFFAFTQVFQTSHSTHLASKSDLGNLIVMQKGQKRTKAVNVDKILQLDSAKYSHNRRILKQYLDATRSALLFARKVVLVEGLSEKYVLGSILDSYLRKVRPTIKTIDMDSEGIEIVEVGGKIFDPFTALFKGDIEIGLKNKCLCLHDGDLHLSPVDSMNYQNLYKQINSHQPEEGDPVMQKRNIFTFEIDTFFLPNPEDSKVDNLDYLKLVLYRFMKDGDYFKKDQTFSAKVQIIDKLQEAIHSGEINGDNIKGFFQNILGHEVSKPSIALYLSSLLKAKLLNDPIEIATWNGEYAPDIESGIKKFEDLPDFIIPKYIEEGLTWLITERD